MKTPWSNLLQYGIGFAAVTIISLSAICLLIVVGAGVLVAKFSTFIK